MPPIDLPLTADNLNAFADAILTERYWNVLDDSFTYTKASVSDIRLTFSDPLNIEEVYLVDGNGDYILDANGDYIVTLADRFLDTVRINVAPIDRVFTDTTWPAYADSVAFSGPIISQHWPVSLVADNAANYTDQLLVAMTAKRSVTITDDFNQWDERIGRDQGTPGSENYDHWITEDLIGTKNGSNQNFSVSSTPVVETMNLYMNGVRQVRVAGTPTPGEAQYGVSGTNVVLGQPPASTGQWVVCRYYFDFED